MPLQLSVFFRSNYHLTTHNHEKQSPTPNDGVGWENLDLSHSTMHLIWLQPNSCFSFRNVARSNDNNKGGSRVINPSRHWPQWLGCDLYPSQALASSWHCRQQWTVLPGPCALMVPFNCHGWASSTDVNWRKRKGEKVMYAKYLHVRRTSYEWGTTTTRWIALCLLIIIKMMNIGKLDLWWHWQKCTSRKTSRKWLKPTISLSALVEK